MWRFLFILVICLTASAFETQYDVSQHYGVKLVEPGQFSYLASLRFKSNNMHFCGASIISSRLLITAAHCLRPPYTPPIDFNQLYTVVGSLKLSEDGVMYAIEKYVIHENFNILYHHDIAILKTKSHIHFSERVRPIKLVSHEISIGSKVTVAGWGITTLKLRLLARNKHLYIEDTDNALYLSMKNLNMTICAQMEKPYPVFASTELCSAPNPGIGSCSEDSGGPLVHGGSLVGIVSRVTIEIVGNIIRMCSTGPTVYTKISAYATWINKHEKLLMKINKTSY